MTDTAIFIWRENQTTTEFNFPGFFLLVELYYKSIYKFTLSLNYVPRLITYPSTVLCRQSVFQG